MWCLGRSAPQAGYLPCAVAMGPSEAHSPPRYHYTSDSGKSFPAELGFLIWKQKHPDPLGSPRESSCGAHTQAGGTPPWWLRTGLQPRG